MKKILFTFLVILLIGLNGCVPQSTKDINIKLKTVDDVSLACKVDSDCTLVNADFGFGCCFAGACDPIDYSLEKYIALNEKSFLDLKLADCPKKCGPAPMCEPRPINNKFTAKCVDTICKKVPV